MYNYSPLNSPDAPQYHNMNRQQHSTIHNMNYDLNKQGSAHNSSVGHEGRTPYFGPSQPWQPVQHMPVTQPVQYTPAMQPAQHTPAMQPAQHTPAWPPVQHTPTIKPVEHTPIMQQSQAFGQYRTKESWQQIQPTVVYQPLQTTQRLNGTYEANYQTNLTAQQPSSQPIYTMSQTQLPTGNIIYGHVPLRPVGQDQQQTDIAPQKLFNGNNVAKSVSKHIGGKCKTRHSTAKI